MVRDTVSYLPQTPVPASPVYEPTSYFSWRLTSFVISNIETCFRPPKTAFSFSSALIMRLFFLSCSLWRLIYCQIFLVTWVRGIAPLPITAPSEALGCIGFMNAALGFLFLAMYG